MKTKMLILIFPSFFQIFNFPSVTPIQYIWTFLSVKDFSATARLRILKFGTKLDSDELYCVAKQPHIAYQSLFVHFSFPPMKIYVTDYSVPIGASGFKSSVHFQKVKAYCVNEN